MGALDAVAQLQIIFTELQVILQRRLSFRLSRRAVKSPVQSVRVGSSLPLVSKVKPQRHRVVPSGTLDVQFGQSLDSAVLFVCVILSALAACSFRKAAGAAARGVLAAAESN